MTKKRQKGKGLILPKGRLSWDKIKRPEKPKKQVNLGKKMRGAPYGSVAVAEHGYLPGEKPETYDDNPIKQFGMWALQNATPAVLAGASLMRGWKGAAAYTLGNMMYPTSNTFDFRHPDYQHVQKQKPQYPSAGPRKNY